MTSFPWYDNLYCITCWILCIIISMRINFLSQQIFTLVYISLFYQMHCIDCDTTKQIKTDRQHVVIIDADIYPLRTQYLSNQLFSINYWKNLLTKIPFKVSNFSSAPISSFFQARAWRWQGKLRTLDLSSLKYLEKVYPKMAAGFVRSQNPKWPPVAILEM